jgi:hypothetical protein
MLTFEFSRNGVLRAQDAETPMRSISIWRADADALHLGTRNEGVLAPIAIKAAALWQKWTGQNISLDYGHWKIIESSPAVVRLELDDGSAPPHIEMVLRRITD